MKTLVLFVASCFALTAGAEVPSLINYQGIRLVDTKTVLAKVAQLPIKEWRYKEQPDPNIRHIGPMEQDFHRLFGYGDDNTTISTIDPDGVALAAIQELAKRLAQLEKQNTQLMQEIQTLKAGNSLGETRK